jgi:hypothetical protein
VCDFCADFCVWNGNPCFLQINSSQRSFFFFGGVVGLVVGVRGGVVELAGLGVLAGGLGVQGGSGLIVESLQGTSGKKKLFHTHNSSSIIGVLLFLSKKKINRSEVTFHYHVHKRCIPYHIYNASMWKNRLHEFLLQQKDTSS